MENTVTDPSITANMPLLAVVFGLVVGYGLCWLINRQKTKKLESAERMALSNKVQLDKASVDAKRLDNMLMAKSQEVIEIAERLATLEARWFATSDYHKAMIIKNAKKAEAE